MVNSCGQRCNFYSSFTTTTVISGPNADRPRYVRILLTLRDGRPWSDHSPTDPPAARNPDVGHDLLRVVLLAFETLKHRATRRRSAAGGTGPTRSFRAHDRNSWRPRCAGEICRPGCASDLWALCRCTVEYRVLLRPDKPMRTLAYPYHLVGIFWLACSKLKQREGQTSHLLMGRCDGTILLKGGV